MDIKLEDVIAIVRKIQDNYNEDYLDENCYMISAYTEGAFDVCCEILRTLNGIYKTE